jgi:hypothetical protein
VKNDPLKIIKEDVIMEEEEKCVEKESLSSCVSDSIKTEKQDSNVKIKITENKRRRRSNSREKKRHRSRSNSLENIHDNELDEVYSCEEDNSEEEEPSYEQIERSKGKSGGLFSNISKGIKNIFTSNKKDENKDKKERKEAKKKLKKQKKVLYTVSESSNLKNKVWEHEVDTNILTFKFEFLKEKVAFATGDPYQCKTCEGILNKESKLEKIENSNKTLWICEFCGEKNEIFLENEEIPTSDCVDYFLQSFNQINKNLKGYNYNDEQSLFSVLILVEVCVCQHQLQVDINSKEIL